MVTTSAHRDGNQYLPRRFHIWMLIAIVGAVGDSVLAFGLVWTSSGFGPAAVAATTTATIVPRVVFMVLGGVAGDRHGPHRTLVVVSAAQIGILAIILGVVSWLGTSALLLALIGFVTGLAAGFQSPAATAYPRLLAGNAENVPKALARISGGIQIARIVGVPLGGVLVSIAGLAMIIVANAFATACVLVALKWVVPTISFERTSAAPSVGFLQSFRDGLRVVGQLQVWPFLISVALLCGAVLPSIAVSVPIAARSRGWSSRDAASIDAAWAVGLLTVTFLVGTLGTFRSPKLALTSGPLLASVGLLILGNATNSWRAVAAGALIGCGTAVFTTHVAPLLILKAPEEMLVRFQALLGVSQLLPVAIMNAPIAWAASYSNAQFAFVVAAALCIVSGALQVVQSAEVASWNFLTTENKK